LEPRRRWRATSEAPQAADPERFATVQGFNSGDRFLDHVHSHDKVWICRRIDIARHWRAVHPPMHK
jgi:hypothetical protein